MRYVVVAVVVVISVTTVAGGFRNDPPRPRFATLPADFEVHGVGVADLSNRGVAASDITDYRALVKSLRAKTGFGAFVRKQLPAGAQELLTDDVEMGLFGDAKSPEEAERQVTRRLARHINYAMTRTSCYDKDELRDITLSETAKTLIELGEKRSVYENERLNRELLSLAFPKLIAPTPNDYSTVRVRIKPGKPVVLVTSSHYQCRWVVTVEKGATLAGVIQIGNTAQELTGTDAPVVYMAGVLPNGKPSGHDAFNVSKVGTKEYERLDTIVKGVTGRQFTNYQGDHDAKPEGYTIVPSAK